MGLFGGGNSKSYSTTETQTSGFSEVTGEVANIQGDSNAVTLTDQGAIENALKFAGETVDRSLGSVEVASNQATARASEAIAAVSESARGEVQDLGREAIKWGVFGVLGYGAFQAIGKIWGGK